MKTPVAFIVFNRPEVTRQVFAEIAKAQPSQLFLIADGPRHDQDRKKCAIVRAIIQAIDWPCDVKANFSEINLGCRARVQSGLDWVFDQAEEAIILEDDCLPHPAFFPYCEELLARYRDETRVATISGTNESVIPETPYSYTLSRYTHSWGWATWRRYWLKYDRRMLDWPRLGRRWIRKLEPTKGADKFWSFNFQSVFDGSIDTWDFQHIYTLWKNDWLSCIPRENLIANLGFNAEATHSSEPTHPMAAQPFGNPAFPLLHPSKIERDAAYDSALSEKLVNIYRVPLLRRLSWQLTAATPAPVWNAARSIKRALTKS